MIENNFRRFLVTCSFIIKRLPAETNLRKLFFYCYLKVVLLIRACMSATTNAVLISVAF